MGQRISLVRIEYLRWLADQTFIDQLRKYIANETIAQTFCSTATSALDQFAQDIANGENAIQSLGNAFRRFVADFLLQISRMIVQQLIFNAISGAM